MQRKLILFELNEVPYRIVEEFVHWRPKSCLAGLLRRCQQFETYAEDRGHLSPWVTWPTLHRGVADDRHGITSFGQDLTELNRQCPPVWSILARAGVSTGVFGSLHSYPPPDDLDALANYAFYVPDTFAAGSECFPKQLSAFQQFNLAMAGASGRNVDRRVHWRGALRMLARLPDLGLRADTMLRLGGQLVAERVQPWRRTRRRTCQVVLAFDIFMKQLRRARPAFATFFTNHVASSMHRYWAAAFPGDYDEFHVTDEWVRTYRNEIDFTMCAFDRFLGRLVRFVERDRDYRLLVASSMGQAATVARHFETQLYITDLSKFMTALGVGQGDWSRRPAMAPDTSAVVSADRTAAFQAALDGLRIDGKSVYYVPHEGGFFHIRLGHADAAERIREVMLDGQRRPIADLGLAHVKIDDRAGCTAYHVPQGTLLIYDPRTAKEASPHQTPPRVRISTLDVAPLILSYFDVRRPEYMSRPTLRAA